MCQNQDVELHLSESKSASRLTYSNSLSDSRQNCVDESELTFLPFMWLAQHLLPRRQKHVIRIKCLFLIELNKTCLDKAINGMISLQLMFYSAHSCCQLLAHHFLSLSPLSNPCSLKLRPDPGLDESKQASSPSSLICLLLIGILHIYPVTWLMFFHLSSLGPESSYLVIIPTSRHEHSRTHNHTWALGIHTITNTYIHTHSHILA